MTDEQIKKALECCMNNNKGCEECPLEQLECITNEENRLIMLAFDLIKRLSEEKERLEYVLMAVMHSVDKWLEGDELKQDEANRACTMREKTLQITEKLQKKIMRLQEAGEEAISCFTRMESLYKIKCKELDVAKSEAYREMGKYLIDKSKNGIVLAADIPDYVKELSEVSDNGN